MHSVEDFKVSPITQIVSPREYAFCRRFVGCVPHASVVAPVVRTPRSEVTLHVVGLGGLGVGIHKKKSLTLVRTEGPQTKSLLLLLLVVVVVAVVVVTVAVVGEGWGRGRPGLWWPWRLWWSGYSATPTYCLNIRQSCIKFELGNI